MTVFFFEFQREGDEEVTHKLQALVPGDRKIFNYIGWGIETSWQNVFQSGGVNHWSYGKQRGEKKVRISFFFLQQK